MTITVSRSKGVCVLHCSGSLTLGGGENRLRAELDKELGRGESFVVLDFTELRYMDSSGIGEVVASSKRALERNAVIKIVVAPDGAVRRIFSITCLDRAFEVFDNVREAVASFGA